MTVEHTPHHTAKQLNMHLKRVLQVYYRAGFTVRYIFIDDEFEKGKKELPKAWWIVDDEIRNFCACLSDIELRKCKKDRRKTTDKKKVTRKRNTGKTTATKMIKTEPKDGDCNDLYPSFDWTVNIPNFFQDEFAVDKPFLDDNKISSAKICRIVSRGSVREEQEDLSRASSHRESFTEVDMEDDEIIDIWKTTPIEDDIPYNLSTYCHMCVEIVNPTATTITQKKTKSKVIQGSPSLVSNVKGLRRSRNDSQPQKGC